MKRVILLGTTVALLSLTACSGNTIASPPSEPSNVDSVTYPAVTTSASPSAPSAAPTKPSAVVGDCFKTKVLFEFTDVTEPVSCAAGQYTEKTVAILDIPSSLSMTFPERQALFDLEQTGTKLISAQQQQVEGFYAEMKPVYKQCDEEVNQAVGLEGDRVSLFGVDLTGPNAEQWENGERWARCNVVRSLPPDGKHKVPRLLPLPTELASAANRYENQVCLVHASGSNIEDTCDSRSFLDGAWLRLLDGIPISDAGPYPGSEAKAKALLHTRCLRLARPFAKSGKYGLKRDRIFSDGWLPNWNSKRAATYTDIWADPDGEFRCYILNITWVGAPA